MILKTDTNNMFLWIFLLVVFFSYSEHLLLVSTLIMSDNYPAHFSRDVSWACGFLLFTRPCSNKKKRSKAAAIHDLLLISEFYKITEPLTEPLPPLVDRCV